MVCEKKHSEAYLIFISARFCIKKMEHGAELSLFLRTKAITLKHSSL